MKKLTVLLIFLCGFIRSQDIYENIYSLYQEYDSSKVQYSNTNFTVNAIITTDIEHNKIVVGDQNSIEHAVFIIKDVQLYNNITTFRCLNYPTNYLCTVKVYNDNYYHIFEIIYSDKNKFRYKQLKN